MNYFQEKKAEWAKQRWGKFTGSNAYKLFGKGFNSYVEEVACQKYTSYEHSDFEGTWEMREGKKKEPEAFAFHKAQLMQLEPFIDGRLRIEYYGDNNPIFQPYDDDRFRDWVGISLDSLVVKSDGTPYLTGEYKCPKRDTHMMYIRKIKNGIDLKEYKPEYYWQIQLGILVSGVSFSHFCSYNEYFPYKHRMHIVEVFPNKNDHILLKSKLSQAIEEAHKILSELKNQ